MKKINLFTIVLLLGVSPFPAQSGEIFSPSKGISYDSFVKAMMNSANTFANGKDCSFNASPKAPGLLLTIKSERGTLNLSVSDKNEIFHVKTTEESTEYTITGVGSIKITHASDAFERVAITSDQTNSTIGCEIDY